MRSSVIENIINKLNQNQSLIYCFKKASFGNVDYVKIIYKKLKKGSTHRLSDYCGEFFLIKNESDTYIGAVYDMKTDLHWVVLKEFRKKGYLSKALDDYILPYLAQIGREKQTISIDENIGKSNYMASCRVADYLEFKKVDSNIFEIDLSTFKVKNNFKIIYPKISDAKINELSKELLFAQDILFKLGEELNSVSKINEEILSISWRLALINSDLKGVGLIEEI